MRRSKTIAIFAAALMLGSCSETSEKAENSSAEESTAETTAVTTKADDSSKPDDVTATEEEDTLYDWTPISKAYLAGDPSGLDEMQTEIYKRASYVIDKVITDDMDDYAKELAIHDFIVQNVTYDINMLGIFEDHGEHAADPYGALVDGKCICSGYTTTFNMFMDMLEIPCTSTLAAADANEAHAWNMVQINGHWYYMDVTWDDPVPDTKGRPEQHKYFNTSKEVMADRHLWDSSSDPVCDTDIDSYAAHELVTVSSTEDIVNVMEAAFNKRSMNVYIIPENPEGWSLEEGDDSETYLNASQIGGDMLKKAQKEFSKNHGSCICQWQRIQIGDKVAAAGYMFVF
ncbi:transglutaminase domain-containing protein [Ruminococcus albus]|uniref:Transglutaminase-like superfamily protein n=1 Tax=Ruminococcus albus TaxID=1264 RepID=A0A1H7H9P5_RUMAL|nr:transglutaminase domain-containing protein [Ruminococcus albus]SEK46507.1 Transglutaminase-like superfamily protein [Ruminococcus albus]